MSDRGTQPPAITWTPAKLQAFKQAYAEAALDHSSVVVFEGQAINLGYAKYLIIYLEGAMK